MQQSAAEQTVVSETGRQQKRGVTHKTAQQPANTFTDLKNKVTKAAQYVKKDGA